MRMKKRQERREKKKKRSPSIRAGVQLEFARMQGNAFLGHLAKYLQPVVLQLNI